MGKGMRCCGFIFCGIILLWHSGVVAIEIQVIQNLQFPTTVQSTSSQRVTVAPDDSGAAIFSATGDPFQTVTVTVRESSGFMVQGAEEIKVNKFKYGGSLTKRRKSGIGVFDAAGVLTNMRIGATAKIPRNIPSGFYQGTFTLRIVYR